MAYHVPITNYPLLFDPPFVVGLVLLGTAIGCRLLQTLRTPLSTVSALEKGVLSAGVGLGLLQYLAFGLGSAHLLTPRWVAVGMILLIAVFAPDMGRVLRGLARTWRRRDRPVRWIEIGMALLAVVLFVTFLQALCPCTDPDGLGYHLRAPKHWLQSGTLGYLPTVIQTNSPMGVEMLFSLALAVWSDTAAKLIHFAFGLLALLGIYALGRRLRSPTVGFASMAAFLLVLPTATLPLFTLAYIDLGLTFEFVCAVLAWFLWSRTRTHAWLPCAALCAGFAASFKLTGVSVGLALSALVFIEQVRNGTKLPNVLRNTGLVVAITMLPLLPWLGRAWLLTGNPFCPLLARLFPTRDWNPQLATALETYMRYFNWASSHTTWTLHFRRNLLLLATGAFLALMSLLIWRWRSRDIRSLLVLTTLMTLTCLAGTGFYLRYLVFLYPLYFLLLFAALEPLLRKSRIAQGAFLFILAINGWADIHHSTPRPDIALQVADGQLGREAYLSQSLLVMPLWTYINTHLPADARLATVDFGSVYYCERYCFILSEYSLRSIRFDTWETFLEDLRRNHIDYLIVSKTIEETSPKVPEYLSRGTLEYLAWGNRTPFLQRLVHDHGQLLTSAEDLRLYRLEGLAMAPALK